LAWKWGLQESFINTHPYLSAAPIVVTPNLLTFGTESIDSNFDLAITASNTIRLQAPTDWRYNFSTLSAGTITLTASNTGVAYRVTGSLSNITVPTLTSAAAGVFWQFLNTGSSNLSVTLTGTTDITSPITIYPGGTYQLRWTGSAFVGNQDKDAPANPTTWATLPAIQTVDLSLNGLSNVGLQRFAKAAPTFRPTDICSCQLWFDVADASKVDVSGSNILRFRDKSGFSYDASLTGSNNIVYGLPIAGRSVAQFPTANPGTFLTPTFTSSTYARSTFWVFRWTSSNYANPGGYITLSPLESPTYNNYGTRLIRDPANLWSNEPYVGGVGGVGTGQVVDSTLAGPLARTFLIAQTVDLSFTGLRTCTYNGIDSSSIGGSGYRFVASDYYRIGPYFAGNALGELIMYSNALSIADRKKVEGYLAWKWGIDLPSNHPYFAAPPSGSNVSSNEPFALATLDRYNALTLTGSNAVTAGLLEYRIPNQVIGQVFPLSAADTGTLYRMGVTTTSNVTVPTLALSNAGVFWRFQNTGTSNQAVTFSGTSDITSPVTVYPGATYTVLWTGSNYIGSQDKDAPGALITATDAFLVANAFGGRTSYSSYDGVTWVSNATNDTYNKPTWTGTAWVSGNRRSANGFNWRPSPTIATLTGTSTVAWNGKIAVCYDGQIRTSTDGLTWTSSGRSLNAAVLDITWGNDRFMASKLTTDNSQYAYSFDASTWYDGGLVFDPNGLFNLIDKVKNRKPSN